jgi:AraC-like DNA-binding protein
MVPAIAGMLAVRGVDLRPMLREAGLPDEALRGEIIAPLGRVQRLLDSLARYTANPLFGITLGEQVPSGALGVTEFLMRSAPTVVDGMKVLCEFATLINPILDFRLQTDGGDARLHFAIASQRDGLGTHLNEYTFAVIFCQFAMVLGQRLPVEEVWFAHERSDHRAEVAARFGSRVTFGAADCGLLVRGESLTRRPTTSDPVLFEFLLGQARSQIANLGTRDVISQVARVVEAQLSSGDVSAAAIAKAMATTVRSLQRHLADAGTSYREVLAHVRQRRRAELARGGLTEADIARRLGFADASSMRRSLDRAVMTPAVAPRRDRTRPSRGARCCGRC